MRTRSLILLVLPVILAFQGAACHIPTTVFAADFTGKVVGVIDGDTIKVLHNGHADRIRLSGIDCPEKGQAFGKRAKQAASALAFGKEVTLQTHGKDKYKRILGAVILLDGMNLNQELVKQGWCWWYRKYAPGDTVLEELEQAAREERKGLWADRQPVTPSMEWIQRGVGGRTVALNSIMDNSILLDLPTMDCGNRLAIPHRQPVADLVVSQQERR